MRESDVKRLTSRRKDGSKKVFTGRVVLFGAAQTGQVDQVAGDDGEKTPAEGAPKTLQTVVVGPFTCKGIPSPPR